MRRTQGCLCIDRNYGVNRKHIGHIWLCRNLTFTCLILELLHIFAKTEAKPWILGFSSKDTWACPHWLLSSPRLGECYSYLTEICHKFLYNGRYYWGGAPNWDLLQEQYMLIRAESSLQCLHLNAWLFISKTSIRWQMWNLQTSRFIWGGTQQLKGKFLSFFPSYTPPLLLPPHVLPFFSQFPSFLSLPTSFIPPFFVPLPLSILYPSSFLMPHFPLSFSLLQFYRFSFFLFINFGFISSFFRSLPLE